AASSRDWGMPLFPRKRPVRRNGMTFLTPLFWVGAAAVGIPILIHLVRRERSQTFLYSSLRFLRPITRKSFKYLKVRNPWILLLRALFILILVAAFARPYWPGAAS